MEAKDEGSELVDSFYSVFFSFLFIYLGLSFLVVCLVLSFLVVCVCPPAGALVATPPLRL